MIHYFDSAAASRPEPEVLNFYFEAMQDDFANQEAQHQLAYQARRHLEQAARLLTSSLLGEPDKFDVIWATSATECFRIIAQFFQNKTVISSHLEHPALLANFKRFTNLELLKNNSSGQIILPDNPLKAAAFIVHHVQSETGVIQNLEPLRCNFPEATAMSDTVQSAARIALPEKLDLYIVSGIKFGAPGGAAIMFKRSAPALKKFPAFAADMRSLDYALSRINVPLCRALAFAADLRSKRMAEDFKKVSELQQYLADSMKQAGIMPLLPPGITTTPYITNFFLPGVQAAVIVRTLSQAGVHCASGSACAAEAGGPSPSLLALGKSREDGFSGLRISLDHTITVNDIDFLVSELKTALKNY